jgi:Flp pilus assembly protein TadG
MRATIGTFRRTLRGQALVETALMLPIILILLLGAIDFGRLFFSWVTLHQAARIAANHASIDTTTISADIPDLIQREADGMNCTLGTPLLQYTSAGVVTTSPQLSDYAHVTLTCDFSLLTPLAGLFFGDPIAMTAVSSFPVRTGVLAGPGGGGPPPPPPPEQCRTIPDFEGMSIGGARLAWTSAGFVGTFTTSADDTETVDPDSMIITPLDPECPDPLAIFNATIQIEALPSEPGPAGCEVVPNLIGMTLTDAEDAWADSAFTGTLTSVPTPGDPDAVVTAQVTAPDSSEPGITCLDPAADVEITLGDPWPDPPAAPCQVPHLIDKTRPVGQADWYAHGFAAGTFSPTNGNWKIKWQSLVGFTWVPCESEIVVDNQEP